MFTTTNSYDPKCFCLKGFIYMYKILQRSANSVVRGSCGESDIQIADLSKSSTQVRTAVLVRSEDTEVSSQRVLMV